MSWIKMRTNLATDPRVFNMAAVTGKNVCCVIGALYWIWALADEHTTDGILVGYTTAAIDRATGIRGLCAAMQSLKPKPWMIVHPDGRIQIPEFEEHNGKSAKKRAQTAVRVSRVRNAPALQDEPQCNAVGVTPVTLPALAREEKIREEKETPKPPAAEPPGFARFWQAWPRGARKVGRPQCLKLWGRRGLEAQADSIVAALDRFKRSPDWRKDGGQFIPAPLVWLNQDRWEAAAGLVVGAAEVPAEVADRRAKARQWLRESGDNATAARIDFRQQHPDCRLDDSQLEAWPVFQDWVFLECVTDAGVVA